MMPKAAIGAVAVLIILVVVVFHTRQKNSNTNEALKQNIMQIELGMSKEDVMQIMGPPKASLAKAQSGSRYNEVWFYQTASIVSEPARCHFDDSGKVIIVVCGDDYYLSADIRRPPIEPTRDSAVVPDTSG